MSRGRSFYGLLSLGRAEMIIFRKMEQKRAPDFIDLIESSLNRHAVIGDGSIGLRLHCEQKGQLAAQAVAHCANRSEEHTSELQSLMRISYAVFCLKKKKNTYKTENIKHITN